MSVDCRFQRWLVSALAGGTIGLVGSIIVIYFFQIHPAVLRGMLPRPAAWPVIAATIVGATAGGLLGGLYGATKLTSLLSSIIKGLGIGVGVAVLLGLINSHHHPSHIADEIAFRWLVFGVPAFGTLGACIGLMSGLAQSRNRRQPE